MVPAFVVSHPRDKNNDAHHTDEDLSAGTPRDVARMGHPRFAVGLDRKSKSRDGLRLGTLVSGWVCIAKARTTAGPSTSLRMTGFWGGAIISKQGWSAPLKGACGDPIYW